MEESNNNSGENQANPQVELFKGLEEKLTSKIGDQDKKFNDLYSSQQKLIDAINAMGNNIPTKKVENDNLSDLLITDPDLAVSKIEERVEARIKKQLMSESQRNQEDSRVLNELASEFPELSDQNSELTKAALDIYAKLSDRDKQSPLAYEAAVSKAALKVGVLPKSKRRNGDDGEFSLSSGKGGKSSKEAKIDPKTLAFAELMARATGRDINDKKYQESLASYAKKYQQN